MRRIITAVEEGSLFEQYNIAPGDEITEINHNKNFDIIDFMIETAKENSSFKSRFSTDWC